MFAFADPTELWLEVLPEVQTRAWQHAAHASPTSRWNVYINQVCAEVVLAWIRAEHAPAAAHSQSSWELVNGSVITVGNTRLALVPTEAIDDAELVVPQEWIDIPDWAADYYLAVQAQLEPEEEAWIRVWGYATHQQLKAGRYDADDRTYCLDTAGLTQDWSTLWVTMRFCPAAQTRADLDPLPALPVAQAEQLIQRLSHPDLAFPRLAIPFQQWGALLQQSAWQQRLSQQRQAGIATPNRGVRLSQWLQQQVTAGWQLIDSLWETEAPLAVSLRSASVPQADVTQAKLIELAGHRVALVLQLSQEADGRIAVVIQLHPAEDAASAPDSDQPAVVPETLELRLLAPDGSILQSVRAGTQDNYIQLRRFRCTLDTAFQVQIELNSNQVTESFEV